MPDLYSSGDQYKRTLSDALAVEADIAKAVSDHLRLRLSGEQQKQVTKQYTYNSEAYRLYLKGVYFASKYTKGGSDKGIEYLHQAIAIDPNYALAYDGLAYYYRVADDWFMSPQESMPKAKEAVEKALALDDSISQSHAEMGEVHLWYDWDWQGAEREFKRAIELDPNFLIRTTAFFLYVSDEQSKALQKTGKP